ncbi:hypothetical protein, partial [Sanguibacteroides justesenii]|uniref:hypothetical protein n=2 Tax=Sanguibacteroides justesenii TaxID=1547597 RepID=UPI001F17472A
QHPRSTPPGPFHLATPPESGCKDKTTLSPFPNFLSHFFQEKIKREAIILRMNRLKKKETNAFSREREIENRSLRIKIRGT